MANKAAIMQIKNNVHHLSLGFLEGWTPCGKYDHWQDESVFHLSDEQASRPVLPIPPLSQGAAVFCSVTRPAGNSKHSNQLLKYKPTQCWTVN